MAITILGGALQGVRAVPIEVEVDLLQRLPGISIVGLAASAVKESAERVRSALTAASEKFPRARVVVNLAPADVPKGGTALDLPVALGILAADGQLPADRVEGVLAAGELALSGELRPVRGALSLALLAREEGKALVLPRACATEAQVVPGVQVIGARTLAEVIGWMRGEGSVAPVPEPEALERRACLDLADVRGQHMARHALELAAAGGHHVLMSGPPGCGKSMLAQRLPGILPALGFSEALEATQVHSAAGVLRGQGMLTQRPFRAPHHTITVAGMVGDARLRPGEVSLAHHGVLFLDEAPELGRAVVEVLRQPLQDGTIQLTRARGTATYPARFMLVLASNPCPCGYRGSQNRCRCTDGEVHRYQRKLSGPILDRIDLHVWMEPVPTEDLLHGPPGEASAVVRRRVEAARAIQSGRGQAAPNGQLTAEQIREVCDLDAEARDTLSAGVETHELSGRGAGRVLRIARTAADLEGVGRVGARHIATALVYRTEGTR